MKPEIVHPKGFNLLKEEIRYEKFSNIFDDFLAQSLSEETRKAYVNDFKKFARYLAFKEIAFNPKTFSSKEMAEFRDFLLNEAEQSRATVKRCLASLKRFWDFLIERYDLKFNPVKAINRPRVRLTVKTSELTNKEVVTLFNAIEYKNKEGSLRVTGYLEKAILEVMFYTGLRKSEVINIKTKDIFKEGEETFVSVVTKGDLEWDIHLSKKVVNAIDDYLELRENPHNSPYLFLGSKRKTQLTPRSINKLFDRVARNAGIEKKISPHSSRATVAGNLYEQGASLEDQATYLRHADPRMTLEYNKRRLDKSRDTGRLIKYEH